MKLREGRRLDGFDMGMSITGYYLSRKILASWERFML